MIQSYSQTYTHLYKVEEDVHLLLSRLLSIA